MLSLQRTLGQRFADCFKPESVVQSSLAPCKALISGEVLEPLPVPSIRHMTCPAGATRSVEREPTGVRPLDFISILFGGKYVQTGKEGVWHGGTCGLHPDRVAPRDPHHR